MNRKPFTLIPASKYEVEKAQQLVELGWPAVEPVLPQILEWLKDLNWPVARVLQPFVASIGAPLAPVVRDVLVGTDSCWKYSLMVGVLTYSEPLQRALMTELKWLAEGSCRADSDEGVQEEAIKLLNKTSVP